MNLSISHFSDLHYCERHLEWVDRAFTAGVDEAIKRHSDVAVLSGDSFDAAIPLHHPAVGRLLKQVGRLASYMPTLILQGTFSHDRLGALDVFRHLNPKFPIYVASEARQVLLWKDLDGVWEFTEDDDAIAATADVAVRYASRRVLFSCLPSINRATVREATADAATSDSVDALLARWAPINLAATAAGVPTVMVTHGTINGCMTESKQAMVSPDHEFGTAALFGAHASAVMIGHIHKHQGWEFGGRRIAYPGSITKLIFGHDGKSGCLFWEVGAGKSSFEFKELPARNLVDIVFDGPPDPAEFRRRLAEHRGAFIRVRYSVDEEHRGAVNTEELKALLKDADVADYKIEAHVNPIQRSRAPGISSAATLAERLMRWCELTGTDPKPLLERLEILESGQEPGAMKPSIGVAA